jgi:hypothetical protein
MKLSLFIVLLLTQASAWSQVYKSKVNLFTVAARDNRGKTPEQIRQANIDNHKAFVALNIDNSLLYKSDAGKLSVLDRHTAETLMEEAMINPVVSVYSIQKYDSKGIGFCFGRAMFTNIYLAMGGFNRAHIKKAFLVGPMQKGAWGWHVTTIVESQDDEGKEIWLAIDPAIGRVLEVTEWFNEWNKYSDDKKLRLYFAESGKFGVTASRYDEIDMANSFYNSYFNDMMKWFEENSDHVEELLKHPAAADVMN